MIRRWPDRTAVVQVLMAVLGAAVLAAVVVFLMRQSGVGMPYPLALTVLLVLLALRWTVRQAVPPDLYFGPGSGQGSAEEGSYNWSGLDGSPMSRWEFRLEWADGAPERFANTVRPALAAVVDERLRLRHGLTRASDPDRARELVGEEVWRLLEATPRDQTPAVKPSRTPAVKELTAIIAALESV